VIVPDGSEPPPVNAMVYRPSAHPGCVAPHLWLEDGSSLYDHFGPGYTLLATDRRDASELAGLEDAANKLGIPLKITAPKDNRLGRRYMANLAIIRPDQHVAWRGDKLPEDLESLLRRITGNLDFSPEQ
jgi:hypothetical protein